MLSEFYTQFWLIKQGRFDDLAKYTRTQDRRFVEEANLVIDNLISNSPALITLLTDPGTVTGVVTTTVTLAVGLQKVVDAWETHQEKKLEREQKKLEMVKMLVEFANTLRPGIDEQTRVIIMKAMTSSCLKLLDRE